MFLGMTAGTMNPLCLWEADIIPERYSRMSKLAAHIVWLCGFLHSQEAAMSGRCGMNVFKWGSIKMLCKCGAGRENEGVMWGGYCRK